MEEEEAENDPAKEAGVDPAEMDSAIVEEEPVSSAKTAEEETIITDNGSVADERENRDESSETIKDEA